MVNGPYVLVMSTESMIIYLDEPMWNDSTATSFRSLCTHWWTNSGGWLFHLPLIPVSSVSLLIHKTSYRFRICSFFDFYNDIVEKPDSSKANVRRTPHRWKVDFAWKLNIDSSMVEVLQTNLMRFHFYFSSRSNYNVEYQTIHFSNGIIENNEHQSGWEWKFIVIVFLIRQK